MTLRSKIYLLSLVAPLVLSCLVVLVGTFAISSVLHRLHQNLLVREISFVGIHIEDEYQILVDAAVEDFPHYAAAAQQTIKDRMAAGEFPVSGDLFLFSLQGEILFHTKQEMGFPAPLPLTQAASQADSGSLTLDWNGQSVFCVFKKYHPWDWIIAQSVPVGKMYKDRNAYLQTVSLIAGAILCLSLALSYVVSRKLAGRVEASRECLKQAREGDLGARIKVDSPDELGVVQEGINSLIHSVEEEISKRKQLEDLLSNIVNSMPSILVGVDPEGRITQWNKGAEKASGKMAEEVQGRFLADVFPQLAKEMNRVHSVIRKRTPYSQNRVPSNRDGETRFSDITVFPLISNGLQGAVVRVDDITERVRIEEMMIQTEKMLSVGGLAAGMAHEINNPLAGIIQNAQVLNNRLTKNYEKNLDAAQESGISMEALALYLQKRNVLKLIDAIVESGQRASEIVDNMLSFSRKGESKMACCDLPGMLDKTIALASSDYDLKKKYDFRHIEIVREYQADLPPLPCEAGKIQQVILNLLANAAQAMASQENRAAPQRIIIRARQDGDMVCIEVEDNGPGMDEATRRRAFEPFFTTKEVGVGTGLGLSVSYFIVTENHHGLMSVESFPGKGSKFIMLLPLTKEADAE